MDKRKGLAAEVVRTEHPPEAPATSTTPRPRGSVSSCPTVADVPTVPTKSGGPCLSTAVQPVWPLFPFSFLYVTILSCHSSEIEDSLVFE